MIRPGRRYVGTVMRLAINLKDGSCADFDPDSVSALIMSPDGTQTTYVYGTDAALEKTNAGDYTLDFTLTMSGIWHYRWITGGTLAIAEEGHFSVRHSPIMEGAARSDYGRRC